MDNQIAIIGLGGIAHGIAAHLARNGIAFLGIGRRGVISWSSALSLTNGQSISWNSTSSDQDIARIKTAFFCVKAYQLEHAVEAHVKRLPAKSTIITVCNGAIDDIHRNFRKRWPHFGWAHGLADFGVSLQDQGYFQRGRGELVWGPFAEEADDQIGRSSEQTLKSLSNDQDPSILFRKLPTIDQHFRKKWALNAVVNSLCAAYSLDRNGALLECWDLVTELIDEVVQLSRLRWPDENKLDRVSLEQYIRDVVSKTKDNENSMVADIRQGRTTELDWLLRLPEYREGIERFPLIAKYCNKILL